MPALLAPLFLLGVAAVAWPLIAHLAERERPDAVGFPSLAFLERTPAPLTSRRQLRDPLLFALRALAIAALAFAFARPVIAPRGAAALAATQRRDVVVLLDRSFSMRVGDRWARARAAVEKEIGALTLGDRITLVAFDRQAHAVTLTTGDAAALKAGLDSLAPTDAPTRLAPAIALAQQRLAASDAPRKAVVVISDFHRSMWDLAADARLAPGTALTTVDVGSGGPIVNHGVRAVEVKRDRAGNGERIVVGARLANAGPAITGVRVRLDVAGRQVEEKRVDLPKDGGATIAFAPVVVPPDPVQARVSLDADALAGDDAYHVVLTRAPVVPVLLVAARESPFLPRALAVGDDPAFEVITRAPDAVGPADLAKVRVVILADGALPRALAPRLLAFVEQGGGLITALGERAMPGTWPSAARALLPGSLRATTERIAQGGAVLGGVDRQHPALSVFAGAHAGDLGAPRFYRYRPIDTTAGILARFDDGGVALTEHQVVGGHVITFASTFDGLWNDLPRQPVFVPLMHQLVRFAARYRAVPRAYAVGSALLPAELAGVPRDAAARWSVIAPGGERWSVGGAALSPTLDLVHAGIHELRPGGNPAARPVLVAANIDPGELDFTPFDPARLVNALLPPGAAPVAASTATAQAAELATLAEREARQSTWWYLLAAVALLLAAETWLAWRTRAVRATVE
ncbi:MAG: VWA domain-containing protein [Gemmatimonadetes bacterium]|nr:VWA domain-containing protein [Gemmatimonadota bacterium]